MTIESMQQSVTAYSLAVTQASTLDANSQAIARSIQQGLITENLETWKKHELGGAEFSLRNFLSYRQLLVNSFVITKTCIIVFTRILSLLINRISFVD